MLMAGEAAVEHGSAGKAAAPGVGVKEVASAGRVCRTAGHLWCFERAKLSKIL